MASITTAPARIAVGTEGIRGTLRAPWFKKVAASVAIAAFSSLFLPAVLAKAGRVVQDRQRERELKVAVSEGIVQPVTAAVTRAELFAAGLIPTAATGSAGYGAVLEEWLAASSKAGAQLETYLERHNSTNDRLRDEWKPLFDAVTDYLRVSSDLEQLDRAAAVTRIHDNLVGPYPAAANGVDWPVIRGPKTAKPYYPKFRELGDQLLAARDIMLLDVRSARLAGFSHHVLEL